MKKLKNTMKRIATLGLTAVLLTNSFPAAAFATEIDGTEPAIVMDTELPEGSEEVFAGESEGASDEVLSEEATEDKAEGISDEDISTQELSDEKNDATGDVVTPSTVDVSDDTDENDEKDSKKDKEEHPAFEESKNADGVKITVTADEGVFPEGSTLSVEKVTKAQEEQVEEAVENERNEDQNVAASYTFDIKILDKDGNEIEPADEAQVKVSFTLDEVADSNLETNIYHITDGEGSGLTAGASAVLETVNLTAEKLEVETDGDTATAETDGFSLYTVEFTYNDLRYVLNGDSSIVLSEILDQVGLTGEVAAVEISDTSLFSASNESGEWIVTAHQPFSTTEWMKVTINGVTYEITVTDTQGTPTTIGGTDYLLFTGFTATGGNGTNYAKLVDGNTSTDWCATKSYNNGDPNAPAGDFNGGTEAPAFVEFHADEPIIPKGYVLTYDNSVNENWKPTSWALKAKLSESDDWTTIHSSNSSLGNGSHFEIACTNDGDNQYQYFRFEVYEVGTTMTLDLHELQIYAQFTYTPVSARDATCTEYGLTSDGYLRNDGKYFADANGTTELTVGNGLIAKIPHTGVHHEASDSNIEYWQCSMCSKYFTDAACTQEVTADEVLKGIFGTLTAGTNGESGYYTLESKTYTLTEDVSTAGYIYVPEGVTATIDLAGHTIDRGLTSAITNGMVIWVAGSLTVTDSGTGGKIKGGMNSENNVSCVLVYSDNGSPAFTLQGGTLIGNTSYQFNSAVLAPSNSSITISGGKITGDVYGILSNGNVAVSGGEISGNSTGIRSQNNSVSVSGNPVITNNTNANVMLYYGDASVLTIAGELTDGANIGITKGGGSKPTDNAPVTITSGYGTYNDVSPDTYFSLDNNGQIQTGESEYMTLVMGWNEDKTEIAVGTAMRTVTFDLQGHGSAIDAVSLLSGYKLIEPTEPTAEGWSFGGWFTDEDCTEANEWDFDSGVTSDMTLYALWTQGQTYRVTLPENMIIVSADNEAVGGKYPTGTNIRFKVTPDYVVDGDVKNGEDVLIADGDGIYTVTVADTDITITATIKKAAEPNKTLSGSESYTAQDGDVLTGSTSGTVTIANNANITLSDVTITGGIVCDGTATITLVGTNCATGASQKAGIQIGGSGTTLTIRGNGSLTANGGQDSAGIGLSRAWNPDGNVIGGNIVIEGGDITANGNSQWGAGIGTGVIYGNGSAKTARIGNVTIKGGTVKATGGSDADGIGTGYTYNPCTNAIGTVTIYDGIEMVDSSSIKDFANVVYMHVDGETETNVTDSKTDYFFISENGDHKIIGPPHAHSFTYSASGATITAKCTNTDGNCPLTNLRTTLTIAAPESLTYDGVAKAAMITDENSIQGSAAIVYKQSDMTLESIPVYAGTYTASITLGEGDGAATASVEYTIAPKSVTITGLSAENKTYDGTTDATVTGTATIDGVLNADSATVSVSAGNASFADATAGTGKTVTFCGYSLSGAAAGNYTLSAQPASVTANITQKSVTVTAKAQSVEVGDAISQDVSNVELSGAVEGHTLSAVTLTGDTSAVTDSGTITPSAATIMSGSTDVTSNYAITYSSGTLTVTNAQVYISGITASNKTYDGGTSATITGTAVLKKVRDDSVVNGLSITGDITATFANKNVGTGKAVTISAATLSDTTNYTLNIDKSNEMLGLTANITAKPVTVTGITVTNRAYNGEKTVALTGGTVNDVESGDIVTVDLNSATGTMTDANAGTGKAVTVTGVALSGTDAGNYSLPAQPTGMTVDITKAAAQNPTAITRKYLYSRNNSDSFTLTGLPADCGTVTWKNPSKTGNVSYTTEPSITQTGVLSYTVESGAVNTSGTISVVAETQNYEDVTFTVNISLVDQIPVKLKTGSSVSLRSNTLTYGQTLSALVFNTAVFVSDDAEGNTIAGTLAWKEPDTVPIAGTTSAAWIFTPTDGTYASLEDTVAITVNKKSISSATVTLGSALTYNGSEQTQSVLKVELSGTDITPYCEISGNNGTNAGSYTLTVTAKADSNYTGSATKNFTIAKKAITPTVAVSGSYSYTGSAITPTVSVKDGGKELASTDFSLSVTDNINAGKGKVTVSAKSGGNYSFEAKTVEFDINKAAHNDETTSAELKYGMSGSVELASLVVPGATCELGTISDDDSVLSGIPSVTGTVLSFGFKAEAEVGKTATVTVYVKNATNYLDYDITATLTVIDCAHEHTEIRDAKAATCTEQGYTGDTYCTECGKKISSGTATPIDPDNHAYDAGVITKQPTIFEEGIKTYTCSRCHHTYTEAVSRVDDGEDHSDLINDVTDNDGNTKAEVKTEQKEDGSTETTVSVGGQEVEKTIKDADGNETIQTQIWVGGLSASYHYTGAAIKPAIHVYDGTKKLISGTDYTASYKNNTKVGTNATITITFKGNYKGTAKEKVTFAITPAVLGEDVKALDFAVAGTGKLQKPAPALVWTSTGKTVAGKNFSFTYKDAAGNEVSGVKGEGTYTVTVTPKNVNFTGSATATITVTSKKLLLSKASVTLKPNKYTYTGDPIIPTSGTYTLKLNGVTLTENSDYVVESVTNNTNAGTATIIFAAKEGNAAGYVGTKTATFKIVKGRELKEGDGFTYSYSTSVAYAKGGAKPSVIVKDGEDTLVLNKDYTVSYSKNTAVTNGATAILSIKGKGNYKGSVKLYYAVTTQNIANLKNGITVADKLESGKGFKNPSVTIIDLDGKKLKAGTDFKLGTDYSEPDADGRVTVSVEGISKYNGSTSVSYRYIKATQQISKTKAMKSIAAQTYTGKAIRLKNSDLTGILYVGNKKTPTYLVPGTDFVMLSYSNNTKAGTAKVTLKGIGSYGSTKTLTFKIKQKKGDYKGALVGGEWTN